MSEGLHYFAAGQLSAGYFDGSYSERAEDLSAVLPPGRYLFENDVVKLLAEEGSSTPAALGAVIELFETQAGGRAGPTPEEEWRCTLKLHGEYFDGRFYLGPKSRLSPGCDAPVMIRLLEPERADSFQLGSKFEIWEGRVVGTGTILALL